MKNKIQNAIIKKVSLKMDKHTFLQLKLTFQTKSIDLVAMTIPLLYHPIPTLFSSFPDISGKIIRRLFHVVGTNSFNNLVDSTVRIKTQGTEVIEIINILDDDLTLSLKRIEEEKLRIRNTIFSRNEKEKEI